MDSQNQNSNSRGLSTAIARRINELFCIVLTLLLVACGGSGTGTSNNTTSASGTVGGSPTNTTYVDLTQAKLLSDSELQTPAFAGLPLPSTEEMTWLQANHKKIRSLTYDKDFSDLAFLDRLLAGKRIVQLGESSHGTREFSQAKVRLIKYLHENLGYNVLAFEASTIGCYLQEQEFAKTQGIATLGNCIFSVWDTKEVQELFDYIARTHQTKQPLQLAGFDMQFSSAFDRPEIVGPWLQQTLTLSGDSSFTNVEKLIEDSIRLALDGESCYNDKQSTKCKNFLAHYQEQIDQLSQLNARFKPYAMNADSQLRPTMMMAWLSIDNLIKRITVTLSFSNNFQFTEPRDIGMAESITTLATSVFPDEKIIIWAHNSHIGRGASGYPNSGKPMGSFLDTQWQQQIYSIGLFMLRGTTAGNDRSVMKVMAPIDGSLEAYSASLRLAAFFLPIARENQVGNGDDWLYRPTYAYIWGNYLTHDALNAQFDAVLMIDYSKMPEYLH